MQDVLRSTVMDNGEQYVIMDLILLMLKLSVNNWDITITIIMIISICKSLSDVVFAIYTFFHLLSQLIWLFPYRPGGSSQLIWNTYMSSNSSDTCYGNSSYCPLTSVTSCSHSEDVTVECSK